MRKIDVLLLSALILYDYGAQTLVDRDIISMGNKVITSTSHFLGSDQNDFKISGEAGDYALLDEEKGFLDLNAADGTKVKNIHYHQLAKVNTAAAASVGQENQLTNVFINLPDYSVVEMIEAPEEFLSETLAEENTSTFALANVTTFSPESMSDLSQLEVISEEDEGNLQFADSDGDGLFNFEDQCPGLAGVARFEGCPVPDSDGDGINDEEDRCPTAIGTVDNGGCPVEEAVETNTIETDFTVDQTTHTDNYTEAQFELIGNDILSNDDFNVLVQLADKMINNNGSKIILEHTANARAAKQVKTIVTYLKDLGVNNSQIEIIAKEDTGIGDKDELHVKLQY